MKKVFTAAGIILLLGLAWYLFIKPYDYLVRFEVKTTPGTANQMIKIWNNTLDQNAGIEQESLSELYQTFEFGDSIHNYHWVIKRRTDSTSLVKVYAGDPQNSFKNKISIPFSDTDFEKRTRRMLQDYGGLLNDHLSKINVTFLGESLIPFKFCACTTLETKQGQKAKGMMRDHNYLGGQLLKHKIELDGPPMVEVTTWNVDKDSIQFNFCYPIIKRESLPDLGDIRFKKITSRKALKAEFNGNYIFSDRAWYVLRDYAKDRGLKITDQPLEIFYNNPNFGGDELEWKTEVYMPLVQESE